MLLVVDDDDTVTSALRLLLQREGFTVSVAYDGKQALDRIKRQLPQLAIVDIGLPDIHGFEICNQIKRYADVPIIMLSGNDDSDTIVAAIDQYADDYVVKPFNHKELIARIKNLLRRSSLSTSISTPEIIVNNDLRINFSQHWIEKQGRQIMLTPIESRLLHLLWSHQGHPLSTDVLLARCWDDAGDSSPDALRVHIHKLREKIEQNPFRPRYIVTVRGVGYLFAKNG